ncbi:beta propeller repeat domain-containing protein, WD40-like protein [Gottschalkia acidurici 9a]|uniref:Beta propeller repeat domain-containing protein, WD40-like protein n=1 Tax=Gottschalkia acidurici (strain ATCC 7906 / DSM 604 / BCRC 14475 / CIP 104303 / KCTC 5404 / NCIMB 10678 / 9a) TaxID=1128398 RepID=K0AY01_GOTA9|nr:PD40 domain-containing protein [Gottschalkia acidurici]AFS77657.1 beta propeller repeat domain-containing protein, WD40-like protein [Gottschalkia acidurici 9a]
MRKYITFTLIFVITIVCILQSPITFASNNFVGLDPSIDISPNDDRIVFSYYQKGVASIYTSKIDGTDVVQLTKDEEEKNSHLYPVYSSDGSKIMFISTPKSQTSLESSIWIMDQDGSNKKEIMKADGFINKAVFSPDQNRIYFSKSTSYKNFSPIARKSHHGFDIYSISIDGKDLKQLTFDKSYNLGSLNITPGGNALIFTKFEEYEETIYLLQLDGSKKIDTIEPKNLKKSSLYYPALSQDDKFLTFSTVSNERGIFHYDLFIMNLETKESKQVTDLKSHASRPVYFHNSNKILFSQDMNWAKNPSKYEIRILDIDSSNTDTGKYNIEKININIPSK